MQLVKRIKVAGIVGVVILAVSLLFAFAPAPQKKNRVVPPDAAKEKNPMPNDATSFAAGKNIYNLKCTSCHGKKGKGDGPKSAEFDDKPQDFTAAEFKKQSDGELCWKITMGNTTMPCFKHQMTKDQRWQVITYLRKL